MSNDDEVETITVDAKGRKIKVKSKVAKGLPAPANDDEDEESGTRLVARGQRTVSIPDGGSTQISIPGGERLDAGVDVDRISGQVRASSIKKISEVVQQHPDESLSIIRSWLAEEGGAERA
jgi:flagellar M-ring protein FliF